MNETETETPGTPPQPDRGTEGQRGSASPTGDADLFAPVSSSILRTAARRVASAWSNEAAAALDHAEVVEELVGITRAIELERAGDIEPETAAGAVLRRRILDLLRAETIRVWSSDPVPPSSAEMLEVLQSFERAQAALEPRWDQRFGAHLAAPSGLELVVEVAHDLRSPLTSILFLSETLRKGQSGDVNEVQRRQLGIIYSAALGLISVASDVIELTRGGDQLVDRDSSPFSVTEILQSVNDIVQPLAEEKGLAVRISPPTTDQRLGYPVALSRVLLNLTTNALKYTDEGVIEIVARSRGLTRVEFSVRDTGPGIESAVIDTIYQPFRRDRARRSYHFSGTGLGLAISRKLVEAMGSELKLETRARWGTRFYFDLDLPSASTL